MKIAVIAKQYQYGGWAYTYAGVVESKEWKIDLLRSTSVSSILPAFTEANKYACHVRFVTLESAREDYGLQINL